MQHRPAKIAHKSPVVHRLKLVGTVGTGRSLETSLDLKSSSPTFMVDLLIDQNQEDYFRIKSGGKVAYISKKGLASSSHSSNYLFRSLADQGISIVNKVERLVLTGLVHETRAPSGQIVHARRPGWVTEKTYVFGDGTAYTNGHRDRDGSVMVSFPPVTRFSAAGTHEGWLNGVGTLLEGQLLLQFVVCFSLMPILLRHFGECANVHENFAAQITGARARGKSTTLYLATSVWENNAPLANWRMTSNGFETEMENHCDGLLILDEATLAGENPTARRAALSDQIMMFSSGQGRTRHGVGAAVEDTRGGLLSTSNETLLPSIEKQTEVDRAVDVRLHTCHLAGRPFGVLDHPGSSGNPEDVIRKIMSEVGSNGGTPSRVFIQKLTAAVHVSTDGIKAHIRASVTQFRTAAKFTGLTLSQQRVCNHLALVYAAGALARHFGVLPASWKLGPAVLAAFNDMIVRSEDPVVVFERLLNAKLATIKGPRASDNLNLIESVSFGYLYDSPDGLELRFRPERFKALFGHVMGVLPALRSVGALLCESPGRFTIQRRAGSGAVKTRCIVILVRRVEPDGSLQVLRLNGDADDVG